jgi:hypothetical protein
MLTSLLSLEGFHDFSKDKIPATSMSHPEISNFRM